MISGVMLLAVILYSSIHCAKARLSHSQARSKRGKANSSAGLPKGGDEEVDELHFSAFGNLAEVALDHLRLAGADAGQQPFANCPMFPSVARLQGGLQSATHYLGADRPGKARGQTLRHLGVTFAASTDEAVLNRISPRRCVLRFGFRVFLFFRRRRLGLRFRADPVHYVQRARVAGLDEGRAGG